jgi:hypothetical protein
MRPAHRPASCAPIALRHKSAGPAGATITQYQLDGHLIREVIPPASFDVGTASLAALHQYDLAMNVKNASQLKTWRRHTGHSHVVAVVPCAGLGVSSGMSSPAGCSSASSSVQNGGGTYGDQWAGLVTDAPVYGPPNTAFGLKPKPTGDPYGTVEGIWTVGTFTDKPGLLNMESSWVGLGGSDGAAGLIQGGTAQINNTPTPWFELLSSFWDNTYMVPVLGFNVRQGDVVDVNITVDDPQKQFPKTVPWTPFGISTAYFTYTDANLHETTEFTVTNVDQEYDGSTAEWIDEDPTDPTGGRFTLPAYSYIYWQYGYAAGIYGNAGSPTDAAVWPINTKTAPCIAAVPNCTGVSNPWRKTYMYYPGSSTTAHPNGNCEVGVSQIYDMNSDQENWYTTWHAPSNPPASCPVYNP